MKNIIDLTNYKNFYKTKKDLNELKNDLYTILISINKKAKYWNAAFEKFKREDALSVEQIIYLIEKIINAPLYFWSFGEYNKTYNRFIRRVQLHEFKGGQMSEYSRSYLAFSNFIFYE